MNEKIAEWRNYLRLKNTPRTIDVYTYHVSQLLVTAPERPLAEWTPAQIIAHLADAMERGLSDSSIKQMTGAYRSFFAFALGESSPAAAVPYPKVHVRRQRTLDAETAMKVLASCDTSTHMGTRNLAIFTLMLDTGLRSSEVCRLQLAKVDLGKRRLATIVKGGDEDVAVFSRTTAANLARWLSVRAEYVKPGEGALFVALSWNPKDRGARLTPDGLRIVFREVAKRIGLAGFSPHDLRRTFATIAIRAGAPTRVVQAAGRWGDVSMVERYTADIDAEDFERYSPVEALMKGEQ